MNRKKASAAGLANARYLGSIDELEMNTIPSAGRAFSTMMLPIHAALGSSRRRSYARLTPMSISNSYAPNGTSTANVISHHRTFSSPPTIRTRTVRTRKAALMAPRTISRRSRSLLRFACRNATDSICLSLMPGSQIRGRSRFVSRADESPYQLAAARLQGQLTKSIDVVWRFEQAFLFFSEFAAGRDR
jgi:hypothetical protein